MSPGKKYHGSKRNVPSRDTLQVKQSPRLLPRPQLGSEMKFVMTHTSPHTLPLQFKQLTPLAFPRHDPTHTLGSRRLTNGNDSYMYFIAFEATTMAVFVSNDSGNASQRMNEKSLYIVTPVRVCNVFLRSWPLFITLCPIRYGTPGTVTHWGTYSHI